MSGTAGVPAKTLLYFATCVANLSGELNAFLSIASLSGAMLALLRRLHKSKALCVTA